MRNNKSTQWCVAVFVTLLILGPIGIYAQDTSSVTPTATNPIAAVASKKVIRILPGHPLYRIKDFLRNVQLFFTFDPTQKFETRLDIANEQLREAKQLAEQNTKTFDPQTIQDALSVYQNSMQAIQNPPAILNTNFTEDIGKKIVQNQLEAQQALTFIQDRVQQSAPQRAAVIQQIQQQIIPLIKDQIAVTVEKIRTQISTPSTPSSSDSLYNKLLGKTTEQKFLTCVEECVKIGATAKTCEPQCKQISNVNDMLLEKMEWIESLRPHFNVQAPPPPSAEDDAKFDAMHERAIQQINKEIERRKQQAQ